MHESTQYLGTDLRRYPKALNLTHNPWKQEDHVTVCYEHRALDRSSSTLVLLLCRTDHHCRRPSWLYRSLADSDFFLQVRKIRTRMLQIGPRIQFS